MKHHLLATLLVASSLTSFAACKRRGVSPGGAATAASALPIAQAATVPPAPAAPGLVPRPAVDPRWPQWLPPVSAVTVRMVTRDALEGYSGRPALMVLVESRRACETAGFTLSQTDMRQTRWENRFVFTATRGEELVRIELTGQPARPEFCTFAATTGDFARTLMRRRRR